MIVTYPTVLYSCYFYTLYNLESCTSPLGMETDKIKDSQITVTSIRPGTTASGEQARLRRNIPDWGAWCFDTSRGLKNTLSSDQYIQVDLLVLTNITGIATQGREYKGGNQVVWRYIVSYSRDGRTWNYYKEEGATANFNGAKVCSFKVVFREYLSSEYTNLCRNLSVSVSSFFYFLPFLNNPFSCLSITKCEFIVG